MRHFLIILLLFGFLTAKSQQKQYLIISGSDTIAGWMWNEAGDSVVFSKNAKSIFSLGKLLNSQVYRGPNEDGTAFYPQNATVIADTGDRNISARIVVNSKPHYYEVLTDSVVEKIRFCSNGIDTCEYYRLAGKVKSARFDADYHKGGEQRLHNTFYSPYRPASSLYIKKDDKGNVLERRIYQRTREAFYPEPNKKQQNDLESRFSTYDLDRFKDRTPSINPNLKETEYAEIFGIDKNGMSIYFSSYELTDTTAWGYYNRHLAYIETTVHSVNQLMDTISTEVHIYYRSLMGVLSGTHLLKNHQTGQEEEIQRYTYPLPHLNDYYTVNPDKLVAYPAPDHWYSIPKTLKYDIKKSGKARAELAYFTIEMNGLLFNLDEVLFDELYAIDDLPLFALVLENGVVKSIKVNNEYEITQDWIGKRDHDLLWLLNKKIGIDYHVLEKQGDEWQEIESIQADSITDTIQILRPITAKYVTRTKTTSY